MNKDNLKDTNMLLQRAVDAAIHGVYVTDPEGAIQFVNPGFCRITGYTSQQLIDRKMSILNSGRMTADYYTRLWTRISSGEVWEEEIVNRRADGSLYWAYQIISPITDEDGRVTHYVGIQNDVTRRREMEEELRYLAEMDVLTGIANRRKILDELEREIARATRHKHELSILMLDIDHFKRFNDSYGHETGDAVLRAISTTTEAVLRPSDRLGRWGGEEFVIILPETGCSGASVLAERVLLAARECRAVPGHQITLSIGIATFDTGSPEKESVDSLVRRADEQMYNAKHLGRNQVCAPEQE
ncbi:MAG: sensor domain-containing diguanylate cyclase [Spirochaetaceae bacterium]|nr:MAG: sensor domain-containing diguanylate cyclase [Spirochaetaceae bacterium]